MKPLGILLFLGPLLLVTSCQEPPADARVTQEPRPVERTAESASPEIPRISVADFLSLLEKPEEPGVFVIDVRSRDNFMRGHIPGAVSIPLNDLGKRAPQISRDAPIVTYCT